MAQDRGPEAGALPGAGHGKSPSRTVSYRAGKYVNLECWDSDSDYV